MCFFFQGITSSKAIPAGVKVQDLRLATYIALHSSIRSVDHLSELLSSFYEKDGKKQLRLHRTKYSMLIREVLYPALLETLLSKIRGNPYSLIIDESTDLSSIKYLCVCVKFFDWDEEKMQFMWFAELFVHKIIKRCSSITTFQMHMSFNSSLC